MSSAEPRKIIKFGNSSHVISLPSSWVKENNLSKGDIVFIEKNGNNELIILPSKDDMSYSEKERKIIISVDGKDPETLRREITSAYINGFGSIILNGKTLKSKLSQIKNTTDFLIGLSTLAHSDGELLLKDVLSHEKLPPQEVISRINITIAAMFSHLRIAINSKDFVKKYNEIRSLDIEINRNYLLVWKLMKKYSYNGANNNGSSLNPTDLYNLWWLAMNQEYIGDEIKRIARALTKTEFTVGEYSKLFEMVKAAEEYYKDSIYSLNKQDRELALDLVRKPLAKECKKILDRNQNLALESLCDRFLTISRHIHYIIKISIY